MDKEIFKVLGIQKTTNDSNSKIYTYPDWIDGYLEKRKQDGDLITGVTTGYHKLDEMTSGLQPSDLIILAARPGIGKTALALSIAMRAAILEGVPTVFFSLEMSKEQLLKRMLCAWGHVNLNRFQKRLLSDEERDKLYHAAHIIYQAPIYIDDTSNLSSKDLLNYCRRLKSVKNLGLVMVDYLQLLQVSGSIESQELKAADISRSLKGLAEELKLPVVALSQLNRKVEERNNPRPVISDLPASGGIEREADVISFIYRDFFYNNDKIKSKKENAEIIIAKNRNGSVGNVELTYLESYASFENPGFTS